MFYRFNLGDLLVELAVQAQNLSSERNEATDKAEKF
jgi:hypothetical protein